MFVTRIVAALCALIPVVGLGVYLGYYADFSYDLAPLNADDRREVTGCYKWGGYTIEADDNLLKFFRGKELIMQGTASYQRSRDVRVTSEIEFRLDPRFMTIEAIHAPGAQTYIHTTRLGSMPFFRVYDRNPPHGRSVEFAKSAC